MKIFVKGGSDGERLTRCGMVEAESQGVECLTINDRRLLAVKGISRQGEADGGKVGAELMGTPRDGTCQKQMIGRAARQKGEGGEGSFAFVLRFFCRETNPFDVADLIPTDAKVDDSFRRRLFFAFRQH